LTLKSWHSLEAAAGVGAKVEAREKAKARARIPVRKLLEKQHQPARVRVKRRASQVRRSRQKEKVRERVKELAREKANRVPEKPMITKNMIATLRKERARERGRKARIQWAPAKAPVKVARANHGMTGVIGVMSPKATVENHPESQKEKAKTLAKEKGKGRERGKARVALGIKPGTWHSASEE